MFVRPIADAEGFTLTRRFEAPPAQVWSAFADLEKLRRWWGPAGWTWLDGSLDFRAGGIFAYALRAPGGEAIRGTVLYGDLVAPSRLHFVQVHTTGSGDRLPLPCLDAVVTLTERAGGTLLEGRCRRLAVPPAELDVAWRRCRAMGAPVADRAGTTPFGRVA